MNFKCSGNLTAAAAEDSKTSNCNQEICGSCSANVFHVSLETLQTAFPTEQIPEREPENPSHTLQYLKKLHVALGHASGAAMAQVLKEAGAQSWLQREARQYVCVLCDAQKRPRTFPKVSTHMAAHLNDCIMLDFVFIFLKREDMNEEHEVCIMSLMDEATRLRQYHYLGAQPSTVAATRALESSWISVFGPPKRLYLDEDSVFNSAKFQQFCAVYNIEPNFTASHAPHQHGLLEQVHEHLSLRQECMGRADAGTRQFGAPSVSTGRSFLSFQRNAATRLWREPQHACIWPLS